MRILLVNKYLYPKGGDARSTHAAGRLLEQNCNEVFYWGMQDKNNSFTDNNEFLISNMDFNRRMNIKEKVKSVARVLYSVEAKRKIKDYIQFIKPEIVHLNNFAHHISPSMIYEIKKKNIPLVMTLHDYKLVCPYWYLLRKGKPCEKCAHKKYYWCLLCRCNKKSFTKSLLNTVEMYLHHKFLYVYNLIDIFISPSRFLAQKIRNMGFKRNIYILPNFINSQDYIAQYKFQERSICYFGRISQEKGLYTLCKAVSILDIKLKIIGTGRIENRLKNWVKQRKIWNIDFLGYKAGNDLYKEIQKSMFTVIASQWYENNPISILESFALGKPVIGTDIGGIPELIVDGKTGLLFKAGDAEDLRNKIKTLLNDENRIIQMGKNARKLIKQSFNPQQYYYKLMYLYRKAKKAKV